MVGGTTPNYGHGGLSMRKLLLLPALLLVFTWAAAQTESSPEAPAKAGSATTVQGCLSGSDGNYMLIDKNGTSYQLTGDTSKLKEHIGHEMKVTGTSGSGTASMGGQASATQTIQVKSFKHISKTCQNAGGMSH
jgi:hypothetical protein